MREIDKLDAPADDATNDKDASTAQFNAGKYDDSGCKSVWLHPLAPSVGDFKETAVRSLISTSKAVRMGKEVADTEHLLAELNGKKDEGNEGKTKPREVRRAMRARKKPNSGSATKAVEGKRKRGSDEKQMLESIARLSTEIKVIAEEEA